MKTLCLISLGLAAAQLHAADPALPEFNSKTIGHPPLLLGDSIRDRAAPLQFGHAFSPGPSLASLRSEPRKITRVSGMLVLEPDPAIDYKMIVKAPDPAIDFKMIVKPAGTESAK